MTMTRTEYQLEDKGPMLLALWWTEAGIATVIVGLRLYTRFLMRGLVLEDWLMLLALVRLLLLLSHTQSSIEASANFALID